jgi:hypothetical protein
MRQKRKKTLTIEAGDQTLGKEDGKGEKSLPEKVEKATKHRKTGNSAHV